MRLGKQLTRALVPAVLRRGPAPAVLRRALAPAALCALLVTACGSQHKPAPVTTTTPGKAASRHNHTVWIYSSLPHGGVQRADSLQIERGIRLALDLAGPNPAKPEVRSAGGAVFQIRYEALNDSATTRVVRRRRGGSGSPSGAGQSDTAITTITRGNSAGSNAAATIRAAERAARNPQTVAYIGDLDSSATRLSLPILNQAGILQITPGSGYPGLTDPYKPPVITQPGEPDRYYPQSPRNLLRLIPDDIVQASAALDELHSLGCQHFAIWEFHRTLESHALVAAIAQTAPLYSMLLVKATPLPPVSKGYSTYQAYALTLRAEIHCAVLAGRVTPAAVMLTTALRQQLGVPVLATDGLCNASWVRGIPTIVRAEAKSIIAGLYCMNPALPVRQYVGTRGPHGFIARYYRAYHQQPDAYGYYGYQAARMVLATLSSVGRDQDERQELVLDLVSGYLFHATDPFSFDEHGNLESYRNGTSAGYAVDVFSNGVPVAHRVVAPSFPHLLSSAG